MSFDTMDERDKLSLSEVPHEIHALSPCIVFLHGEIGCVLVAREQTGFQTLSMKLNLSRDERTAIRG